MMKKIIIWLIFLVGLKGLVWSTSIPLWQFPDEQAHFNHIAFNVEKPNLINLGEGLDLNQEIAISEQLLGTYRDEQGNNSFTYHPEYNLKYSNSRQGIYEEQIKNLPLETRFNLVGREFAYYPEIYYNLSGLVYKLFYYQNLFIRVFAVRIFWLLAHVLMIWLAYLIGKLVFPKSKFLALSVAVLTGFQPMLTFVAAGVTNDNLHNLLFTALIYFCLKLNQKIRVFDLAGLAFTMYLGFINKPQFWISLGIVVPVLFWRWRRFFVLIIAGLFFLYTQGKLPYFEVSSSLVRPDYTLWQHLQFTLNHTFREVLPWYWGVFRWLSLTLPRWVNQVMMRILLVAGIGLVIKIFRRKFEPGLWLIIWSAAIYFLALFFWDWQHIRNLGFSFGIQGRYYFPVIVTCMILIIIGLQAISRYLTLLAGYWFIFLNWIALYWVTASYYDASNLKTFILQASQYKPDFAKSWWLVLALGLYFIFSVIFSIQLFKLFRHEK
ncbi:MAG: DUF2142 domain-containing protein [bacterium]|nr:DUF2142 domain-containing protein [bacterium]